MMTSHSLFTALFFSSHSAFSCASADSLSFLTLQEVRVQ